MRLEAHDTEPGLWVNPDWQEGTPGAFAVVIGVSTYPYLEGGKTPADETYGLGQLQVSALTAYRLFRWLAEDYQVSGCPLARCWLLLSPTEQECKHTPAMAEHLTPPTFANCQRALRLWRHHMVQLPPAAAETSRALFFFSGHGLEVHQEHQVLLPSDYLQPPEPSWNDAISTDNLTKGLASLGVPHQLFLLDACRNDHYTLRAKRVTGADILSEDESARINPRLVAPMLYATASGQQAFQQATPQRGLSLFGQALLDGLTGQPYIHLDPLENHMYAVKLFPLQGYMKERVVQLLQEANAQVLQPIKFGGSNVDDLLLTYLDMAAVPPRPPRVSALSPVRGVGSDEALLSAYEVERSLEGRFSVSRHVPPTLLESTRIYAADPGHDLFGSEDVTALWHQHVRLFALGRRRWLARDGLVLHKVERNAAQDTYRVTLSVASDDLVGYWLQVDTPAGVSHACILPVDDGVVPRYLLEFDLLPKARGQRYVSRLEGFLAIDNAGFLGEAAALWERYRISNVGEAINAFKTSGLEQMVLEHLDSPLAATTSALILLRANRLDLLRHWVRNLANEFEQWPDGPVLWAAQCLRQAADADNVAEAADYLIDLWPRGLPSTSEALGYAASLVSTLKRPGVLLGEKTAASLDRLNERLQEALIYFQPGGLCTVYAGFPPDTDPTALVGPFSD